MPSKRAPKAADEQPKPIPAPFHESYGLLLDGLPDSVIQKVKTRAELRGLDPATADDYLIIELLESARGAYERKKTSSRLAAARRRASKKSLAAAAAVEPLEAAVEPLEAEAAVEPPAEP